MASGDIFSDMCLGVSTSLVTVTPTADSVITWISGDDDPNSQIWGVGSAGSYQMRMAGGDGGNNPNLSKINFIGMKMFITSSQRFGFKSGSGTIFASYSGMEL
jgi:hypothetical protein|tara:strand:- start:484 stop:792 length:309 start_codon:yes stop_codon:yes gene_type:complete